ncbi:protein serine/threonine phosphatase 2C [Cubamyces lactineus]|nr:protein serine/threonine phosphatase 2C [Cubamyces lactineus]
MANDIGKVRPLSSGTVKETDVPDGLGLTCAVTSAKGPRDAMEDAHTIVVPFAGIRGQGLFGVFDGHGGKEAAKWCSKNFPRCLLNALRENQSGRVVDALEHAFHDADGQLEQTWAESDGEKDSGSTAVVAFLRLEEEDGGQSFAPSKQPLAKVLPRAPKTHDGNAAPDPRGAVMPPADVSRVLYCANVGDARAVLCRGGKAIRLTYDHKASDKKEARRIKDEGGLILDGRVDGHLIPTRALGDAPFNQYVTSTPHTAEMELGEQDEFVILACDGLWDVINDEEAVDLVRGLQDPMEAAHQLLNESRCRKTGDNVTVLVVRFQDPPEEKIE